MIHTDYSFYTDIFKGNVIPDETAFNSSVIEAIAYIDYITRGKANNLFSIPESVDMAVCAVAEIIYGDKTERKVKSESVGNHSISYDLSSGKEKEAKKYKKARLYLARTGLLYQGLSYGGI